VGDGAGVQPRAGARDRAVLRAGAALAQDVYGSDAVYGLSNAAWGVGTVTGAVLGSRWKPRRPMLAAVLCAVPGRS
jgi:hypothetical protein